MKNERMDWLEVEELIEKRIAEESEIYDLDSYDIAEIRLETYKECGWDYDAGRDEDDEGGENGEGENVAEKAVGARLHVLPRGIVGVPIHRFGERNGAQIE